MTIQEESDRIVDDYDGVLSAGAAVVTSGGQLKAHYVIHVVSPVWAGGEKKESERLAEAVINTLKKATEIKAGSLAMPSLSSGMFGFPKELAASIIVNNTLDYFERKGSQSTIKLVRFVNLDAETVKLFKTELERSREKPTPMPQDTLAATREISLPKMQSKEKIPSEEEKVIASKEPINFSLVEEIQAPASPMRKSPKRESELDSPGGRQSGQKQRNSSMYASSHKGTPGRNMLVVEESVPLDQWTSDGYESNSQNSDF